MGLPVRLHRADVTPVAIQRPAARQPVVHQVREQLVAEVVQTVVARVLREGFQPFQYRVGRHDEDLGGHGGRRGLLRFVGVVGDPVVVADLHHAVAPGVLRRDLRRHHRELLVALQVRLDDLAVVELVHRVRREHHEQLRAAVADQLGVAPQRIRGARVPAAAVAPLPRRQREHAPRGAVEVPRAPVGQVPGEGSRVVLHRDPHVGDLGVLAVGQREVDQAEPARERHRGLRARRGEQLQPVARTTSEDQHQHLGQRHEALPTAAPGPSRRRAARGPCPRPRTPRGCRGGRRGLRMWTLRARRCHQAAPTGRPSSSSATTAVSGDGGSPSSSAGSSTGGSGSSSITEASWAIATMNAASDGSPARMGTPPTVPP